MGLMKQKKGFFFTFLIILLVSLLVLSSAFYLQVASRKSIQKRVETMNGFLSSSEQDLTRQMYVAGFRSIFVMEAHISTSGTYISNVQSAFNETFFNGTLNGQTETLMDGVTYEDIATALAEKASKIGVTIELRDPRLVVSQSDPWYVNVSLVTNLYMEDDGGLASWNKTAVFSGLVPIDRFDNPLYSISTHGAVTSHIAQTPYTVFANGGDVSNLLAHVQGGYYRASPYAPSFLNRLEGNLSASPQGVESLVDVQRLSQQGVSPLSKSSADYIYFSASNPTSYGISGMPSWFRLDHTHTVYYNISDLEIP